MSGVEKADLAVLCVRGPLARRRELDEIVLAGSFDDDPEFRGVVADDFGDRVRPRVDEAGPRARVWPGVERRQPGDADGRNLLIGQLRAREQIGKGDPVRGAIAPRAAVGPHVDGSLAVRIRREGELVQQRRRQNAVQAHRPQPVRTRPEPLHAVERDERIVERPGNMAAPHREALIGRRDVVELERVLAKVREPRLRPNPIVRALSETGCWQGEHVQERLAIGADPVGWNDVVGKRPAGQRVVDGPRASEERVARIQQLAEIPSAHRRGRDGRGGRQRVAPPDPFFAPEEEQLVAAGIEAPRQQNGTAKMEPELVKAEGIGPVRKARIAAFVPDPAIRVE